MPMMANQQSCAVGRTDAQFARLYATGQNAEKPERLMSRRCELPFPSFDSATKINAHVCNDYDWPQDRSHLFTLEAPMNARRILSALILCLLVTTGASAKKLGKEPDVDLSQYDFRSGDIVFQHLPGKLGSVICEVTDSPLSHCGMVVERKGELQ